MKKVIVIVAGVILALIVGVLVWYNCSLKAVSKKSEVVNFVIEQGTGTKDIVASLKEADLVRSELATLIYIKLHSNISIKSGSYKLDRNQDVKSLIARLDESGKNTNTLK
ncbi:MAG: endolytic transglycosylase MltG, partial [Bacilli bacterium]|nr:endolytic transglycosylase MltG [Bacilli bacterium]